MKASSNRNIEYKCGVCGMSHPRETLLAKRVQFVEMGRGGRVLRSRVTQWVGPCCLEKDADFTRPELAASPGMADTRMANAS